MLRGSVGAAKTLCPQSPSPPPSLCAHNQFTPLLGLAAKGAEHLQEKKLASNSKNAGGSWLEVDGQQPPSVELPPVALSPAALSPAPRAAGAGND